MRDRHFRVQGASTFVTELEPHLHRSGRKMLHGLSVHQKLSDASSTSEASGKQVAHNAFKTGAISKPQLQSARSALVSADEAKHSVVARVTSWADADVDDDDSFSFRGDAANVGTQVEDVQNEPATKRVGPIGLTANAPVFVPTPAPVRDAPLMLTLQQASMCTSKAA